MNDILRLELQVVLQEAWLAGCNYAIAKMEYKTQLIGPDDMEQTAFKLINILEEHNVL